MLLNQMIISFWLFWEMQLDQGRKFSKLNLRLTQQNASQLIITVYYILLVWILNRAKNSFQSGYLQTDNSIAIHHPNSCKCDSRQPSMLKNINAYIFLLKPQATEFYK